MKKRSVEMTSASLRLKSDVAMSAFKDLIAALKTVNEKAEVAKADNETKIATLQAENAAITELFEKNEKIVSNIENLLAV